MLMDNKEKLKKVFDETYEKSLTREHEQKLRHCTDYREELEKRRKEGHVIRGSDLPWKTDEKASQFKLRGGELTIWSGYSFTGKSLLTGQIALSLALTEKVAIASFEMSPVDTLDRMQRQCLINKDSTDPVISMFYEKLDLWLYAHNGNLPLKTTIGMAQYMGQNGYKHIFIDSLMMCTDDDDYNAQKKVVQELRNVAKDYDCHIHLIAHNRKPQANGHKVSRHDILGGSGTSNNADNIIVMDATDPDELRDNPELPTHYAKVDKHRNGKYKGTLSFYLNEKTLQFKRSLNEPDHDYLGLRQYSGSVNVVSMNSYPQY